MKVFLGGTVNGSLWRNEMIPRLKIDYFNPVVDNWNDEAYKLELHEREHCDFCLYLISPLFEGYYALAEVTDDSYKKTDKTIYCYLKEDGGKAFTEEQIKTLDLLGNVVKTNGGVWLKTVDEVVLFLNSADLTEEDTGQRDEYNDVFISYGRRHSITFAHKLHNRLRSKGYDIWFDMNDIPLGVDFQEQIDNGIRKADNFIFVISPHSVKSVYCYKEIILALKYNKRIIPILHIEPTDCWDKLHPVIQKLNWIYFRQIENFDIPLTDWEWQDDFDTSFSGLVSLIDRNKEFVSKHTILLDKSLTWERHHRSFQYLLVGKEREEAQKWMLRAVDPDGFRTEKGGIEQAPCLPTDLHVEYICEARKNGENLMTDAFLMYDRSDLEVKNILRLKLHHYGITSWSDTIDIASGLEFENAIELGMEKADNVIFLLSSNSLASKYCLKELTHALSLHKRVLPLLIDHPTEQQFKDSEVWKLIASLQYIDFTDRNERKEVEVIDHDDVLADVIARKEKTPYEKAIDTLIKEIHSENRYYEQHKVFLVKANMWVRKNKSDSMLLRGHNLENALSWLKTGEGHHNAPIDLHKQYINESYAKANVLGTEVFVSYSRKDGDFARRINLKLQIAEKTTWFDQDSIASSSDFQQEINKGIANSNNFLFIISPDSIASPYCEEEVAYAKSLNKRIITILLRQTDPATLPPALAAVQWINFIDADFEDAFTELSHTLDLDREHVEMHTKWSLRASEWNDKDRAKDLLLRGIQLETAQQWLKEAKEKNKKPAPTVEQIDFIEKSEEHIKAALAFERHKKLKTLRIIVSVVSVAFLLALAFGAYGLLQSRKAISSAKAASRSAELAERNAFYAKKSEKKALEAKTKAEDAKKEAERLAKVAKEKEAEAIEARADAEKKKIVAQNAKIDADQKRIEAQNAEKRAIDKESEARKAKAETEKANKKAMFHLYAFNAKEFANKSIAKQNFNQELKNEKALLALTALELEMVADTYGFQREYAPELLEALQTSYLEFESDLLLNGEMWAVSQREGKWVYSKNAGELNIAHLEQKSKSGLEKWNEINSIQTKYNEQIRKIAFCGTSEVFAFGTTMGNVYLTNSDDKKGYDKIFDYPRQWIVAMTYFDNMNLLVAAANNGGWKLFRTDKKYTLSVHTNPEPIIAMAAGNNVLYTGNKTGVIAQYEIDSIKGVGSKTILYQSKYASVNALAYNPKKQWLIAGMADGEILMYNAMKGGRIVTLPMRHKGIVSTVAFSSDNKWMATGGYDGIVMLWNISNVTDADKLTPIIIENEKRKIISLAFDNDSKSLIFGDDKSMHIRPIDMQQIYNKLQHIMNGKQLSEKEWNYYKKGDLQRPTLR